MGETSPLRIVRTRCHDNREIDIGYLEVQDHGCPEIRWDQLCLDRITDGLVHIVGYPLSEVQPDWKRREISLLECTFSTSLLEETDVYLKFGYPKEGARYDSLSGEWSRNVFPETPEGFSGGGCFGVTKRVTLGGVELPEFKLFGIQSCWLRTERYVKVIPIKLLCDLLTTDGYLRD